VAGEKIFTVILRDITIRKQAEAALQESEQKYSVLFDQAAIPATLTKLPENTFIQVNAAFENVLGYSQQEVFGKTSMELGMVRPDEQARTIAEVEKYGTALNNEKHIFTKSGEVRVVWINVSRVRIGGQNYAITTLQDITERKRAEIELQQAVEDLKRSNAELEQFAYVASHDLQEPLRMVSSYLQLLSRRYQGKLDSNADEFIGYAVDGARRMQGLIEDLLAYSRVGTHGKPFEMVSADQALDRALTQLGVAIHESSADITRTELPTLMADSAQLVQLFQNLIGNAIKFHKPGELPQIEIAAVQEGTAWKFSVRDHGIGLEPQFAERIFVIFQRLNTRTEYPGTGIGLAICKKIVERHGGRIWVESQLGGGAAFYFTFSTSIKGAAP
jgi:PAS domain S-box-containing protein